jgi:GNAT superfamily N-acetyltransferase
MVDGVIVRRADKELAEGIAREYGEVAARHLHFDDGFTLVAVDGDRVVGFVGLAWRKLPEPLPDVAECFIDIIQVAADHRRRGIARRMIEAAEERASAAGAAQIRAWSSDDKTEAIPMWRALGFGLAPATVHPAGSEVRGFFAVKLL